MSKGTTTIIGETDMVPVSNSFLSKKIFFTLIFLTLCVAAREKKPWTFIVYTAADNSLRDFASRNIKQMATVGSSSNINILVHLDIRLLGSKKMTRRYYVEKNNPVQLEMHEKTPMNSGDVQTLISACRWARAGRPVFQCIFRGRD